MAVVVVGGFLGTVVWFALTYAAVRMGVTDAIRKTVRPDVLVPPDYVDNFQLDAGDDESPAS